MVISKYMDQNGIRVWCGTPEEEAEYLEQQRLAAIPKSISMRQARLQLLTLGLYDIFLAALTQMSQAAQVEAEYATSVDRSNPLTAGMVALFGWTEQQTDDYFTAASQL